MIAQQVAGKAVRDALFLSSFSVTDLPKAVITSAFLSLLAVFLMARLLYRYGPHRVIPLVFLASAVLFSAEWMLSSIAPELAAIAIYLHLAVFGAILISGFWSLMNERFDPHTAKRNIAQIAAAATLGGVLGGVLAERVSALLDVQTMLLILAVMNLMCAASVVGIGAPDRSLAPPPVTRMRSGLAIIRGDSYLLRMGALVALVAVMGALLDYALKAAAAAQIEDKESLVAFFATFYASLGVLTFIMQSAFGQKMLQRFGIGYTVATLPAAVLVGGVAGAVVATLWGTALARGSASVLAHSFFRSGFELLYTPVRPNRKRPTKTIIDVAFDRLGDMLGGGLILLLLALLTDLPNELVLLLASVMAIGALLLIRGLHKGYIQQLETNLRKGSVSLKYDQIVDATTQHILAEADVSREREILASQLQLKKEAKTAGTTGLQDLYAHQGDDAGDDTLAQTRSTRTLESEQCARVIAHLTSGDPQFVRHALISDAMDIRLVAYAIPLLADDEVAEDVRTALRWMVPRIVGQLTDALFDPELPLRARQRIPGVLEVSHSARSVDALVRGLADEEFNVRYSCARTLSRMRSRSSELLLPRQIVFKSVRRELSVNTEVWNARKLSIEDTLASEEAPKRAAESANINLNTSLDHVFTMLSLVMDRRAVTLSLPAVFGTDPNLRGTALEYLENVLPDDIRNGLWPHLGSPAPRKRTARESREIVEELERRVGRSSPQS
jgi:ATP/ADP translocase